MRSAGAPRPRAGGFDHLRGGIHRHRIEGEAHRRIRQRLVGLHGALEDGHHLLGALHLARRDAVLSGRGKARHELVDGRQHHASFAQLRQHT